MCLESHVKLADTPLDLSRLRCSAEQGVCPDFSQSKSLGDLIQLSQDEGKDVFIGESCHWERDSSRIGPTTRQAGPKKVPPHDG